MVKIITEEKRKALLERMQQEKEAFEKGWIKKKDNNLDDKVEDGRDILS